MKLSPKEIRKSIGTSLQNVGQKMANEKEEEKFDETAKQDFDSILRDLKVNIDTLDENTQDDVMDLSEPLDKHYKSCKTRIERLKKELAEVEDEMNNGARQVRKKVSRGIEDIIDEYNAKKKEQADS